jgi:hypothetical protein
MDNFAIHFSDLITRIFFPILHPIFGPINDFMADIYMPSARIFAIGLFVATMIWVCLILKKQYVNLDAPTKRWWVDLRLWTVISMLPHLVVYLYF